MIYPYHRNNTRSWRRRGDGEYHFGENGLGIDVKIWGATSDSYFLFDASADSIVMDGYDFGLNDGDFLKFGDAADITMNFDGTNFEIEGAAAATTFLIGADAKLLNVTLKGALTIGKDDTGHDFKVFTATAGSYVLVDESADTFILNAVNMTTTGTITVGVDDTGHDVKFFGATAGSYFLWDESADTAIFNAANISLQGTLTVGVDDTGYDVIFYGATASSNVTFDQSADMLFLNAVGLTHTSGNIGFFGATPSAQVAKIQDFAGDGSTAVNAIIDALEAYGLTASS